MENYGENSSYVESFLCLFMQILSFSGRKTMVKMRMFPD